MHPYVLIYVDCSADEVIDLAGKPTIVKSMSRISLKDLDEDGMIYYFAFAFAQFVFNTLNTFLKTMFLI
jgi:hypothetical protein